MSVMMQVSSISLRLINILTHALCWIHAERSINKLIAPSEEKRNILEDVKEQIWDFYEELKAYKVSQDEVKKTQLRDRFEEIFTHITDYHMLNLALKFSRHTKTGSNLHKISPSSGLIVDRWESHQVPPPIPF